MSAHDHDARRFALELLAFALALLALVLCT